MKKKSTVPNLDEGMKKLILTRLFMYGYAVNGSDTDVFYIGYFCDVPIQVNFWKNTLEVYILTKFCKDLLIKLKRNLVKDILNNNDIEEIEGVLVEFDDKLIAKIMTSKESLLFQFDYKNKV